MFSKPPRVGLALDAPGKDPDNSVRVNPGPVGGRVVAGRHPGDSGYTSGRHRRSEGRTRDLNEVGSRAIALSGELGSGKSAVSEHLATALGARRVSTGEAQRLIAEHRGISTLDLNRLAEADPTIDEEIDSVFRSLASVHEPLVVDSRLAWHFLPEAFKVHLVVDPVEAASRVLRRPGPQTTEHYRSLEEALARMEDRVESERRRFQVVYGIDIFRLANYDLVVDTTQVSPAGVADQVLAGLAGDQAVVSRPALLLDPCRVTAATDDSGGDDAPGPVEVEDLVAEIGRYGFTRLPPIAVAYRRPSFSVVDGGRRLLAAQRCDLPLVPAVLVAPDGEPDGGRRSD
jgi:CMP/dCMP kinase